MRYDNHAGFGIRTTSPRPVCQISRTGGRYYFELYFWKIGF